MPGQNVGIDVGQSQVNPAWYGYFYGLKKLYDFVKTIQPDTKSNILRDVNAQTGTSYTFGLTDSGNVCTFDNSSAVTVTVPPNSAVAFDIGTQIDAIQLGAGKVTFAQGSGVTIRSVDSNKAIAARYGAATLLKIGTDEWVLFGALDA
jgi:hypothetical protein